MYFIPLLVICFVNAGICIIAKKKFGEVLPFSLMIIVTICYISQTIFKTFKIGYFSILFCALASLVYLVWTRKTGSLLRDYVLTGGFVSFVCIFFLFLFVDFGRHLNAWDELMHWGNMVKEMLRLDKFYFVDGSTLIKHKDYPPFISLFEMLFCRFSGGYTEVGVSMAIHIFILSFIVPPILEWLNLKTGIIELVTIGVLSGFTCLTFILWMDIGIFNTIYTDILIAVVFAYSMMIVATDLVYADNFWYITYVLSLGAIISIKQVGIWFVFVSLTYFALRIIMKFGFRKIKTAAMTFIGALFFPIIVYLHWKYLINSYGIIGQFDIASKVSIRKFVENLYRPGFIHDTVFNVFKSYFVTNISRSMMPITYASSIFLMVAMVTSLYFFKSRRPLKEYAILDAVLVGGGIGYGFVMLILYAFCFQKGEMVALNSYPRYMDSYFVGGVFVPIYMLFYDNKEKINEKFAVSKIAVITFLTIALLTPSNMWNELPQSLNGHPREKYEDYAYTLMRHTDDNSNIYVVHDSSKNSGCLEFLSYYTDARFIDTNIIDFFNEDSISANNQEQINEVISELIKCNYLYVVDSSDVLNDCFSIYNYGKQFLEGSVYQITNEDNLMFTKVD